MLSNSYVRRKLERDLERETTSAGRFVDFGIELHVVRQDPGGIELVRGGPPLRVLRTHKFGGMVDTLPDVPIWCGPTRKPVQWCCSEDTEPILLHGDDLPGRLLAYGSEGVGKTALGAQWVALRALELLGTGLEIGVTAPTAPRLDHAYQAMIKLWPARWYRFKTREMLFTLGCGVRVRLVSTHQQSVQEGSRVQGYNWARHLGDEMQDQIDADSDVEMRGRSAPGGIFKRLCTCTAKDAPAWRTWRDRAVESGMWGIHRLIGPSSPFIWSRVWEERKKTLSAREYDRRVLAKDVAPENQVYFAWERGENLKAIPDIGVDECTNERLQPWGRTHALLIGHDPGLTADASILIRAYKTYFDPEPVYWVIGEVVTESQTVEAHAIKLLGAVRPLGLMRVDHRGRLVADRTVLIKADPYTDAANDAERPHRSVYTTLRNHGFVVMPAAMKANATGPAAIPKEARIDMVNRLLCDATGRRRLFVAKKADGSPVAPRLVAAFETLERDAANKAETGKKGVGDLTHYVAGLGYALWGLERPRSQKVFTVGDR